MGYVVLPPRFAVLPPKGDKNKAQNASFYLQPQGFGSIVPTLAVGMLVTIRCIVASTLGIGVESCRL
jgi:hypothetical protein